MRHLSIALALMLAACGSKQSAPTTPTPTPTPTTPASSGVELELGELKLIDVNKNKAVLIHADGSIELDGKTGVKVTRDGKLVKMANGEVGFTLHPDGSITGPGGRKLDVTLSADAVITSGDKTITLDDTGMLVGGNPDAPQMRVEGATTPGLKRTAMLVLIALTTPDEAP